MTIQSNFPNISPSLNLDFANVKALSPLVTFTRASTATYYGTQTAKAEENLILQSQAFENAAWASNQVTETANSTTAPDGTTTADTITETTDTNAHRLGQGLTVLADSYVFSVFLKKGDGATAPDWIQLANTITGSPRYANFNLTTGVVGASSGATGSILSVGNGWYRCSIAFTGVAGITGVNIVFTNNNDGLGGLPSYTGQTTSNVFAWGAQLEQRSSVTAYTPTTTQPITNYIPVLQTALAGVPRFDHNPTTFESLGLEIEEQRSNLLTYSSQFDDAAWSKGDCSVTANTIVAPDGTLTGDKLIENTANSSHVISSNAIPTLGSPQVFSVYAKAAERTRISLGGAGFTGQGFAALFDLATGTMAVNTGGKGTITSVGNGWYRCSIAFTPSNTVSYQIQLAETSGNTTYTGNGFNGVYIWGAQLEAGAFPTSYIPTVASQVTRSADAASMTGSNFSSWYRADEGSFYIDFADVKNTAASLFALDDGTTSQRILNILNGSTTQVAFRVINSGVDQANFSPSSFTALSNVKYASAYKVNDFAAVTNGGAVATDTSGTIPVVTAARIGQNVAGSGYINGYIKRLTYYPLRCTNAQLQALTS